MVAMSRACTPARVLALLPLLAAGLGCTFSTKVSAVSPDIARDLPPIAIRSSLDALGDPENQRRIQRILASPEMKSVQKEMIDGIADASLASIDDPARQRRVAEITGRYARGLMNAMSREMTGDLTQISRAVAVSAVRGAFDEAAGWRGEDLLEPTGEAGLRGLLHAQLAPAITDVLHDPEVQRAMAELARTMGHEALVGARDSLQTAPATAPKQESLLERVKTMANRGVTLISALTWMLIGVVALLVIWIIKLTLRVRRAANAESVGDLVKLPRPVAATDAPRAPPLPTRPLLPRRRIIGTHDRSRSFKARRARSG